MAFFTVSELCAITDGTFFGDERLLDQSPCTAGIDTRTLPKGGLYVPVRGDRFDGHDFIDAALKGGALLTLSEIPVQAPHILVKNTVFAYQEIARAYRNRFSIPVVCITGSVGKTTTKEMVASVLSQQFQTHKTQGNLNNQTGVPTTVLSLNETHEVSVMELGTNHFGEIAAIARVTQPTVCLFTNIGEAHIEFFGSREGILKGKTEMLLHKRENATVIVNADDDLLCTVSPAITYGLSETADVRAVDIVKHGLFGVSFTAEFFGNRLSVTLQESGMHMVQNALASIAVGVTLGVPLDRIKEGLEQFRPQKGRSDLLKTDRFTVIDGSYNANPTSMQSALSVLAEADGRKVCIFGDMLELGEDAPSYHARIASLAREANVSLLLCVGPLARYAATCDNAIAFPDKEALHKALPQLLQDGDTILVKASQGMKLKETVSLLLSM